MKFNFVCRIIFSTVEIKFHRSASGGRYKFFLATSDKQYGGNITVMFDDYSWRKIKERPISSSLWLHIYREDCYGYFDKKWEFRIYDNGSITKMLEIIKDYGFKVYEASY